MGTMLSFGAAVAQRKLEGLLPEDLQDEDENILVNPDLIAYFLDDPEGAFSELEELSKSKKPNHQNMAFFVLGSLYIYEEMEEHSGRLMDIVGNLSRSAITVDPSGVPKDDFLQVMLDTFENAKNGLQAQKIKADWNAGKAAEMLETLDPNAGNRHISVIDNTNE